MQKFNSVWEALEIPEPTDQEKIVFWMSKFKQTNGRLTQLQRAAEAVLYAYDRRFMIIAGSLYGPIDTEISLLSKEVEGINHE